jgi:hypothetical protein
VRLRRGISPARSVGSQPLQYSTHLRTVPFAGTGDVGMPRRFNSVAMARRLRAALARMVLMVGARLAARAIARTVRILRAVAAPFAFLRVALAMAATFTAARAIGAPCRPAIHRARCAPSSTSSARATF